MTPTTFPEVNMLLGKPADWDDKLGTCGALPVLRHENGFMSCWAPTEEDMVTLLAGGVIYLHVTGTGHPPVWLEAARRSTVPLLVDEAPIEDGVHLVILPGLGNRVVMSPELAKMGGTFPPSEMPAAEEKADVGI